MIQSKIRYEKFDKFAGLEVMGEKWEIWEAPSWKMLVFGGKLCPFVIVVKLASLPGNKQLATTCLSNMCFIFVCLSVCFFFPIQSRCITEVHRVLSQHFLGGTCFRGQFFGSLGVRVRWGGPRKIVRWCQKCPLQQNLCKFWCFKHKIELSDAVLS